MLKINLGITLIVSKLVFEANYILNVMLKLLTTNVNSYHILPSKLLFCGHSLLAFSFILFSSSISRSILAISSSILATYFFSYKKYYERR